MHAFVFNIALLAVLLLGLASATLTEMSTVDCEL